MTTINENATVAVFNFESNTIRTLNDEQGVPLFVASDVANALGYQNTNKAIGDHCKGVTKRYPLATAGGIQQVGVIYEPDVYRLIFGSKLQTAKKFQDWVFEHVLPTIRRTDGYVADRHTSDLEVRLARMENLLVVRNFGDVHPDAVDNDQSKQVILDQRKNWRTIYELVNKGLNSIEIGIKLGLDSSGIRYNIRRMRACGILPPDPRQAARVLEKELVARHQKDLI